VAKADLGTKRVCPETGKKFYDLNKDPIVSPFTGMEYPLSFFEEVALVSKKAPKPETETEENTEAEAEDESDEDETDEDAPALDEEPMEMGGDDEDDEGPSANRAAPAGDDLEGFSDDEADLDDDDDDSVLIDDEEDDLGDDIDLAGGEQEDL